MGASTAFPTPSTPGAQLTEQVGAWDEVVLSPHSDCAVAFRLDAAMVGVLHHDGRLEVPLPASVGAVLVKDGLAQPHTAGSGAGWVVAHVRSGDDMDASILLLRLSYLYRRLLRSPDAPSLRRIRRELAQYDLPDALVGLYDAMLAKRAPDSPSLPGAPSSV